MKKTAISLISVVIIAILALCVLFQNHKSISRLQTEKHDLENRVSPSSATLDNKIPEISLMDAEGQNVSIMKEIAKKRITIIDFWASWCNPCIDEMPNIKSIYNRHKDSVGIIGISLDKDRDEWQAAVRELEMNWIQLSDLQGWNSKAARLFNVSSIPYTIIVSQDGTILANGLRGESLQDFINNRMTE